MPAARRASLSAAAISLPPSLSTEPVAGALDVAEARPGAGCPGPGTPYSRAFGLHAASPDCDVVLTHSTAGRPGEQARATWAITWTVSWRGFDGTAPVAGTLPPMTSRATTELAVAEAQSVTTG